MNKCYKYFRKHWKSIIFSLSILIFLAVMFLLLKDQITIFDNYVYNIIIKLKCKPVTYFFEIISFFCSTWFLVLSTILIMVLSKDKKKGFYIVLNILLCFLLNQSFKLIFARTRPEDINLINEFGYSFPSGHSMVSLAFYGFFIYIIAHLKIKKNKKILYCSLLALFVLLIGISRIYLGVHYASDVLAGYALAMAYLIIYIKLIYNKVYNTKKTSITKKLN